MAQISPYTHALWLVLCSLHSSQQPALQLFYIQGPTVPEDRSIPTSSPLFKINIQSSFLVAKNLAENFTLSQSDLSAGWQLLPIMKGLLISVSKG